MEDLMGKNLFVQFNGIRYDRLDVEFKCACGEDYGYEVMGRLKEALHFVNEDGWKREDIKMPIWQNNCRKCGRTISIRPLILPDIDSVAI